MKNKLLIKTLTWRFIAFTTTATLAYIITDKIEIAAAISIWETVIKMTLYYFHEKFWEHK